MSQLSGNIITWLEKIMGPFSCERFDSNRSRHQLWLVSVPDKDYFFKLYSNSGSWSREIYAYNTWSAFGINYFPVLEGIYENDSDYGILISRIYGDPLENMSLETEVTKKIWFVAGMFAKQLKESVWAESFGYVDHMGNPDDFISSDPVEYYNNNIEKNFQKIKQHGVFIVELTSPYRKAVELSYQLKDEKAYPVHTDYTPGNWLVNASGHFTGVIDLEDMKWGLEAEAFVHLLTKNMGNNSYLEQAFFKGYGLDYPSVYPDQMFIVKLWHGLSTLRLGLETNSKKHINRGKRIITELG